MPERPNFLVIMSDQHNPRNLGCAGDAVVRTPNLDGLAAEGWKQVMDRATGPFAFDWAHNNTLQVIPDNATYEREKGAGGPVRFRPGNIVFSYRSNDVIGAIDRPSGEIVWAWGPGVIDGQHKPHMLANGHVLIFDNGTLRGYSRVIELDPLTGEIAWEYRADPKEAFFSPYISGAQRLPNGNTLICEGAKARLFEVTPGGEVVWEFVNPHRSDCGRPSIYRCLRYAPGYAKPLTYLDSRHGFPPFQRGNLEAGGGGGNGALGVTEVIPETSLFPRGAFGLAAISGSAVLLRLRG